MPAASNGDWTSLNPTVVWYNTTNLLIGLNSFAFNANSALGWTFNSTALKFTGGTGFNSLTYFYWAYRQSDCSTIGFSLPVGADPLGTCNQICGDGKRFFDACDDNNTKDLDGCSSKCTIEVGWNCIGGDSISSSKCTEICGDGILFKAQCDDSNTNPNDGCSSTCTIEKGWICTGGNSTSKSVCIEKCGDGLRFVYACDDGNPNYNDGCSSTCTIQHGWSCSGGSSTSPSVCTEICGDGILIYLQCDDGNLVSGDGCSSTCTNETGWDCTKGGLIFPTYCSQICGDGMLFVLECDDGNTMNGDGCSQFCSVQPHYTCSGGSPTSQSHCSEICGDGVLITDQCDDGNTVSGDGCSSSCTIEPYYVCIGGSLISASSCYSTLPLAITLLTTIKNPTLNEVTFYFSIWPSPNDLTQLNFESYFTVNTTENFSLQYDGNGQLELKIVYSNSIQDQTFEFSLNAQSSNLQNLQYRSPSVGMFMVAPTNNLAAAVYDQSTYESASIMHNVFIGITIAYILLLLLSVIANRKYIGIEALGLCQLAYFGLASIRNWHPLTYSIMGLQYSNGYNLQISKSLLKTPTKLQGMGYSTAMLDNFNISLAVLLLPTMAAAIAYLVSFKAKPQPKIYRMRIREAAMKFLCAFGFTTVMFMFYSWTASIEVFARYFDVGNLLTGSIAIAIVSMSAVIVTLVLLQYKPRYFFQFHAAFRDCSFSQNYYWIVMGYRFLFISMLVFGCEFQYTGMLLLPLPIILGMLIWKKMPYKEVSDQRRAMFNELLALLILGAYGYDSFAGWQQHQQLIQQILPYLLIGLLVLGFLINVAVVVLEMVGDAKSGLDDQRQQKLAEQILSMRNRQESNNSVNSELKRVVGMARKRDKLDMIQRMKKLELRYCEEQSTTRTRHVVKLKKLSKDVTQLKIDQKLGEATLRIPPVPQMKNSNNVEESVLDKYRCVPAGKNKYMYMAFGDRYLNGEK